MSSERFRYLRLSVTRECNLACLYCSPRRMTLSEDQGPALKTQELIALARLFVAKGVEHIRLTGGEPLLRPDILDLVGELSSIDGVRCLSMTTNGVCLARMARSLKKNGLNRLNVSLDTLERKRFERLTGEDFLPEVLQGLEASRQAGFSSIRLNVVPIRGFNEDEIFSFLDFASANGLEARFIECFPTRARCERLSGASIPSTELIEKIAFQRGEPEFLGQDPVSGPACYYRFRAGGSRIGFISPVTGNFCLFCERLRLTSQGELLLCLHAEKPIDVKFLLKAPHRDSAENFLDRLLDQKRLFNRSTGLRAPEISCIGG